MAPDPAGVAATPASGPRVQVRHDRLTLVRAVSQPAGVPSTPGGEPLVVARNGRLISRAPTRSADPGQADAAVEPIRVAAFGTGARVAIALFVLSIMLPLNWWVGSVRISPNLLVLLLGTIPCLVMWAGRRRTPIIVSDVLMLLFCVWATAALLLGPLTSPLEAVGILFLQTFGSYILARMTVRDAESMRFMIRCAVVALAVMLPLVLVEALTGQNLILQVAGLFGRTPPAVDAGQRLGLHRVQGPFEHPILMGVFGASILSMAFYAFRDPRHAVLRWIGAPVPFVSAMLSLSTGALLAINLQLGFMLWARLLRTVKTRWRILTWGFVALYLLLDIFTTRSPIHTFVRYMTFSAQSSYNRILIWEFGSAEALRHPFFGIGLGDWKRPRYMSDSMDNFWLVQAVRYGLPALALLFAAIWIILRRMGAMDLRSPELIQLRRGAMFSIVATMISVISVHLWNATYVWFMFLVGSCAWMAIPPDAPKTR